MDDPPKLQDKAGGKSLPNIEPRRHAGSRLADGFDFDDADSYAILGIATVTKSVLNECGMAIQLADAFLRTDAQSARVAVFIHAGDSDNARADP
jgi:hypothetical protein